MWIAIAIITISFMIMFHKQIGAAINRLNCVKTPGGGILNLTEQNAQSVIDPKKEAELLMQEIDNTPLIRELEDKIKGDLEKKKLLGLEVIPVLIRHLAAAAIGYNFSEIYRIIFGSQLNLLDYLNTNQNQPIEAIRPFYNSVAPFFPVYQEYSFEQWLNYLKGALLVVENNGSMNITVKGREFLSFLTKSGLTRDKIG